MDCLPKDILLYIFSLLSITELLRARATCRAWYHIISSCNFFHRLYDERNQEWWIALTSDQGNPDHFCFFNKKSKKWYFFASQPKCWLLQGAADGLLFFVGNEGKMLVVNPLTRGRRLLPDTQFSPRLWLESCLKRKLWTSDSTPMCVQPSMSINIVAEDGGKTFKIIVWGELRTKQVHALVYASATNTWTVRLCPHISPALFKWRFHTTVDGNNIVYSSMQRQRFVLGIYDTETGFLNVNRRLFRVGRMLNFEMYRNEYIKMIVYKGRIFLLSVILGSGFNAYFGRGLMGLWLANSTTWQYELLTEHEIQFPLDEVAAAYDGKDSITVISRMRGSKMLSLNLGTKEWKVLDADTEAWRLADGNARRHTFSAEAFRAFHFKLKFCTAL